MTYNLAVVFTFTVGIGAILALIRFNKINRAWLPFILFLWIGLITEIVSYIITHMHQTNTVTNNVYVLLESFLLTWQFYNWGLFKRRKWLFPVLLSAFALWWIIESLFFGMLQMPMTYFRIFFSFVMVIMSINSFNEQLMKETHNIWLNPVFLICIAFLLYFTFKVIIGSFWISGFKGSYAFSRNIVIAMIYINCIANLIYAFAVLCMDRKHPSSLR